MNRSILDDLLVKEKVNVIKGFFNDKKYTLECPLH